MAIVGLVVAGAVYAAWRGCRFAVKADQMSLAQGAIRLAVWWNGRGLQADERRQIEEFRVHLETMLETERQADGGTTAAYRTIRRSLWEILTRNARDGFAGSEAVVDTAGVRDTSMEEALQRMTHLVYRMRQRVEASAQNETVDERQLWHEASTSMEVLTIAAEMQRRAAEDPSAPRWERLSLAHASGELAYAALCAVVGMADRHPELSEYMRMAKAALTAASADANRQWLTDVVKHCPRHGPASAIE